MSNTPRFKLGETVAYLGKIGQITQYNPDIAWPYCVTRSDGSVLWCDENELNLAIDLSNASKPTRSGHPRFYELIEEMADLHHRKNSDYNGSTDPLGNFRRAENFGIEAWKGILIRLSDKYSRVESLSTKEALVKDESMIDTLKDMAVYSLLAVILLEERAKKK